MTGLKIMLWLTGILCVLTVIGVFMPFTSLQKMAAYFDVEQPADTPFMNYAMRTISVMFVAVGIYFIILALAPLKYGILVPFSAIATILLGVACLIIGPMVAMPAKWFVADGLSCLILGVLIFAFWKHAKSAAATARQG
jgi:hypothetical protein